MVRAASPNQRSTACTAFLPPPSRCWYGTCGIAKPAQYSHVDGEQTRVWCPKCMARAEAECAQRLDNTCDLPWRVLRRVGGSLRCTLCMLAAATRTLTRTQRSYSSAKSASRRPALAVGRPPAMSKLFSALAPTAAKELIGTVVWANNVRDLSDRGPCMEDGELVTRQRQRTTWMDSTPRPDARG